MINKFYKNIDMAMPEANNVANIFFSEDDVNTSILELTLLNKGNKIDLSNCEVYISTTKGVSGELVESMSIIDARNGVVSIMIPKSILSVRGRRNASITIHKKDDTGKLLIKSSPEFYFNVVKSATPSNGDIRKGDEYPVIDALIEDVKHLRDSIPSIDELKGEDGKSIEFTWRGKELGIRQEGDIEYSYVNLQGPPGGGSDGSGREIELRKNHTHIQWRYVGDTDWMDLVALSEIKGETGLKGDSFTYSDFTPEQLLALKGEKGDKGDTGQKGDKGDTGQKGDKGDTGLKGDSFTYSDFTPEQLLALKGEKGDKGDTGQKGDKGDTGLKGDSFTYSDFTPEQLLALKGEKGDKGRDGVDGSIFDDSELRKRDVELGTMISALDMYKVDKVEGKSLSTNDLTDTLKTNYNLAYMHSQQSHAPSDAQRNADITKSEIEAKLIGNISTHSHSMPSHRHDASEIDNISGAQTSSIILDYVYKGNKIVNIEDLNPDTGVFTTKTPLDFSGSKGGGGIFKYINIESQDSFNSIPYELKDPMQNYSMTALTPNTFKIYMGGNAINTYDISKVTNLNLNAFTIEYDSKSIKFEGIDCENALIEVIGTRNRAGWSAFEISTTNKTIRGDSVFPGIDGRQWGVISVVFEVYNYNSELGSLTKVTSQSKINNINTKRDGYDINSRYTDMLDRIYEHMNISKLESFTLPPVFANGTRVRIYNMR